MDHSQRYIGPRSPLEPPDDAHWKQELRHDSSARQASVVDAAASPLPVDEEREEGCGEGGEQDGRDAATRVPADALPSASDNGEEDGEENEDSAASAVHAQTFVFGTGSDGMAIRNWADTGVSPTTCTLYQFNFGSNHERRTSQGLSVSAPTVQQPQRGEHRTVLPFGSRDVAQDVVRASEPSMNRSIPPGSSRLPQPSPSSTVFPVVGAQRQRRGPDVASRSAYDTWRIADRRNLDAERVDPGLDGDFDAGGFPHDGELLPRSNEGNQANEDDVVPREEPRSPLDWLRDNNMEVDMRVARENIGGFESTRREYFPSRDRRAGTDMTAHERVQRGEDPRPTAAFSRIVEDLTRVAVNAVAPGVYEEVRRAVDGPQWDAGINNTLREGRNRRCREWLRSSGSAMPSEGELGRSEEQDVGREQDVEREQDIERAHDIEREQDIEKEQVVGREQDVEREQADDLAGERSAGLASERADWPQLSLPTQRAAIEAELRRTAEQDLERLRAAVTQLRMRTNSPAPSEAELLRRGAEERQWRAQLGLDFPRAPGTPSGQQSSQGPRERPVHSSPRQQPEAVLSTVPEDLTLEAQEYFPTSSFRWRTRLGRGHRSYVEYPDPESPRAQTSRPSHREQLEVANAARARRIRQEQRDRGIPLSSRQQMDLAIAGPSSVPTRRRENVEVDVVSPTDTRHMENEMPSVSRQTQPRQTTHRPERTRPGAFERQTVETPHDIEEQYGPGKSKGKGRDPSEYPDDDDVSDLEIGRGEPEYSVERGWSPHTGDDCNDDPWKSYPGRSSHGECTEALTEPGFWDRAVGAFDDVCRQMFQSPGPSPKLEPHDPPQDSGLNQMASEEVRVVSDVEPLGNGCDLEPSGLVAGPSPELEPCDAPRVWSVSPIRRRNARCIFSIDRIPANHACHDDDVDSSALEDLGSLDSPGKLSSPLVVKEFLLPPDSDLGGLGQDESPTDDRYYTCPGDPGASRERSNLPALRSFSFSSEDSAAFSPTTSAYQTVSPLVTPCDQNRSGDEADIESSPGLTTADEVSPISPTVDELGSSLLRSIESSWSPSTVDEFSPISPTLDELGSSLRNLDNIFSGTTRAVDSAAPSPTEPSFKITAAETTDYAVSIARIPVEPDPMVFLYRPFSMLYNALDLPHCRHNMRAASSPLPLRFPRPPPPDLHPQNVMASEPRLRREQSVDEHIQEAYTAVNLFSVVKPSKDAVPVAEHLARSVSLLPTPELKAGKIRAIRGMGLSSIADDLAKRQQDAEDRDVARQQQAEDASDDVVEQQAGNTSGNGPRPRTGKAQLRLSDLLTNPAFQNTADGPLLRRVKSSRDDTAGEQGPPPQEKKRSIQFGSATRIHTGTSDGVLQLPPPRHPAHPVSSGVIQQHDGEAQPSGVQGYLNATYLIEGSPSNSTPSPYERHKRRRPSREQEYMEMLREMDEDSSPESSPGCSDDEEDPDPLADDVFMNMDIDLYGSVVKRSFELVRRASRVVPKGLSGRVGELEDALRGVQTALEQAGESINGYVASDQAGPGSAGEMVDKSERATHVDQIKDEDPVTSGLQAAEPETDRAAHVEGVDLPAPGPSGLPVTPAAEPEIDRAEHIENLEPRTPIDSAGQRKHPVDAASIHTSSSSSDHEPEPEIERAEHIENTAPRTPTDDTAQQEHPADTASIRTSSTSSSRRRSNALGLFKYDNTNANWSPGHQKATASIGPAAGNTMGDQPSHAERRLSDVARDASRAAAESLLGSRRAMLPPELQMTDTKEKEVRRDSRKKSEDTDADLQKSEWTNPEPRRDSRKKSEEVDVDLKSERADPESTSDARKRSAENRVADLLKSARTNPEPGNGERVDRRLKEVLPMSPVERKEAFSRQLSPTREGNSPSIPIRFPLKLKGKQPAAQTSPERKSEILERLQLSPSRTEGVYIRSPVPVRPAKEIAVPIASPNKNGVPVASPSESAYSAASPAGPPPVPPRPESRKGKHERKGAVVLTKEEIARLRSSPQSDTDDQQRQQKPGDSPNERDDLPPVPPSPRLPADLEPGWEMPRLRPSLDAIKGDPRTAKQEQQRGHELVNPQLPQRFPQAPVSNRKRSTNVKAVPQRTALPPLPIRAKPEYDEDMSDDPEIMRWAREKNGQQWGADRLLNEAVFFKYPKPTKEPEVLERYIRESAKWDHKSNEVLQDGSGFDTGMRITGNEERVRRAQEKYGGDLVQGPGGGTSLFTEAGQREGGRIEEERMEAKRREDAERQARAEEEFKTSPLNIDRGDNIEARRNSSSSIQTTFGPDDTIPESARLEIDDDEPLP